jgi:hypothetical protein
VRRILIFLVAFTGALALYLLLPSSFYNPDGLRVLPGLHEIRIDAAGTATYHPRPWSAGYSPEMYVRAYVQKHLLFPTYAFLSYRIARALGYRDSGVRAVQIANAVSAAIALGLFSLLLAHALNGIGLVVLASLGLAFSSAFSSMASNGAEVVPALPWLMLGLWLILGAELRKKPEMATEKATRMSDLSDPSDLSDRLQLSTPVFVAAGVCFGISAGFYLASGLITLVVAAGQIIAASSLAASSLRREWTRAIIFAGSCFVTALVIYFAVLFMAGYSSLVKILHALTLMPVQGTYGELRPTNLLTVTLGFAHSILPVLPDDFGGMRQLLAEVRAGGIGHYLGLLAAPLVLVLAVAFFAALARVRDQLSKANRQLVLLGLLVFLGALIASLLWDPYHPKLWVYSNVGLWLMIAGFVKHGTKQKIGTLPFSPRKPVVSLFSEFKSSGVPREGIPFSPFAFRLSPLIRSDTRRGYSPRGTVALLGLTLLCIVAANSVHLIQQHQENPRWQVARQIAQRVTRDERRTTDDERLLVLGAWEPEFSYLSLMLPDSCLLSLPDLILEEHRQAPAFEQEASRRIRPVSENGAVYFLNFFNRSEKELTATYARWFRFPEFLPWLESYRPMVCEVMRDEETGISLFQLSAPAWNHR